MRAGNVIASLERGTLRMIAYAAAAAVGILAGASEVHAWAALAGVIALTAWIMLIVGWCRPDLLVFVGAGGVAGLAHGSPMQFSPVWSARSSWSESR